MSEPSGDTDFFNDAVLNSIGWGLGEEAVLAAFNVSVADFLAVGERLMSSSPQDDGRPALYARIALRTKIRQLEAMFGRPAESPDWVAILKAEASSKYTKIRKNADELDVALGSTVKPRTSGLPDVWCGFTSYCPAS